MDAERPTAQPQRPTQPAPAPEPGRAPQPTTGTPSPGPATTPTPPPATGPTPPPATGPTPPPPTGPPPPREQTGPPIQPEQQRTGPPIQPGQAASTIPPEQPAATAKAPQERADAHLWDTGKVQGFQDRWHEVQTSFVDDPKQSVTQARQLVDEAVDELGQSVRHREEELERGGARSADSTEGMRDQVQQYHQLLDRLLSV